MGPIRRQNDTRLRKIAKHLGSSVRRQVSTFDIRRHSEPLLPIFESGAGISGIVFAGSGRETRICPVGPKRLWGEAAVLGWNGGGDF